MATAEQEIDLGPSFPDEPLTTTLLLAAALALAWWPPQ
jgi:hypothetical protein